MAIFHSYVKLPEGNPHPLGISILLDQISFSSVPAHRLQALPQPCHRHAARNGAVRKSAHCQANGCLTEGQLVPQLAKLISEENTVK
jgi:hypothetical protein